MFCNDMKKRFWKSLCQLTLLVGVYKIYLKTLSHKW
jgi:hypothetical protein